MLFDVVNLSQTKVGSIDVADDVFASSVRVDILNLVVKWQLAKRQSGCHKTKGVSEVSGTGAKPYRQKGTGRARFGSLRTPQHRGGATIFGPVVRSHAHNLPKKVRALGLKSALSDKVANNSLIVVDSLSIESNKTKDVVQILKSFDEQKILFVDVDKSAENFLYAINNVMNVNFIPSQGVNVYDILRHSKLVMTQAAIKLVESRLR